MSLDRMWEHLGHAREQLTAAIVEAKDRHDPVDDVEQLRRLDQASRGLDLALNRAVRLRQQDLAR
jgi:hypothetical protein